VAPRIRAIIFDVGRVLIRIDIRKVQEILSNGLPYMPEELWAAIEKDPRWPDWQEGRIAPRDWHLHLCQRLGISLDFEQFKNAWNSTLDPNPILPDRVFERLSRSYKLALLSNTDPIHIAYEEATYSFFQYFRTSARIYSCRVAASKPNPLIFRAALQAVKTNATEAVYVDDIAAFVDAARALGCTGIQFRNPEQLYADLGKIGVKLEHV
jgi:glucose-1-phosphatase